MHKFNLNTMKKTILLVITAITTLVASCKQEKKEEGPSQMEQVMAIHDEVMPEMSTINQLISELEKKTDTTEMAVKYKEAKTNLMDAHTAMMDWMKGFGDRFDSDEILKGKALTEEKQKWLDEEEIKVKEMKDKVNNSIAEAKKLLGLEQ